MRTIARENPPPPRTFWAGVAAIAGGLAAIVLTVPFAAAYFRAYPGFDVLPFWLPSRHRPGAQIVGGGGTIVGT